jgi:plasmid stabilization system protein ParE
MKQLIVSPEAEDELMDAARWYNQREKDLGIKFLTMLDVAFDAIQRRPNWFPIKRGQTRRILMKRFPYAVYFLDEPDAVVVVAVRHTARRNPDL